MKVAVRSWMFAIALAVYLNVTALSAVIRASAYLKSFSC
jgi:hypothetical protein